ncbi:MAG TPA: isocitrate/isopropylmalate family dehydrogenase, partial [Anaerovoracaceae bacterium]|nr:isocitrate/isopropylmalate family dehydrogenase [Anaerovoracaceae bacterium]
MANPMAAILSVSMMLKYTFGLEKESAAVEKAVKAFLAQDHRTADLAGPNDIPMGTKETGQMIADFI